MDIRFLHYLPINTETSTKCNVFFDLEISCPAAYKGSPLENDLIKPPDLCPVGRVADPSLLENLAQNRILLFKLNYSTEPLTEILCGQ